MFWSCGKALDGEVHGSLTEKAGRMRYMFAFILSVVLNVQAEKDKSAGTCGSARRFSDG